MSKNFELLQQAGWGQEYFETHGPRLKTVSNARNEKANERANEKSGSRENVPVETVPAAVETRASAIQSGTSRDEVVNLVQRVFIAPKSTAPRVVMFSGLRRGSGSGWLCARTATILAKHTNKPVCAVDTNFHDPCLHHHFQEQNVSGLGDALHPASHAKSFAKEISGNNLWLLTAGNGPSNSFALLANPALPTRLAELRSEFAYVLIDSPPIDGSGGTAAFGHSIDGVILVLEASGTPREIALRAKRVVESTNAPVIGVVLNQPSDSLLDLFSRIIK